MKIENKSRIDCGKANQTLKQDDSQCLSAPPQSTQLDNHFSSIIIFYWDIFRYDKVFFFHSFLFSFCCLWNRCFLNKFSYLSLLPAPAHPETSLHLRSPTRSRRQKSFAPIMRENHPKNLFHFISRKTLKFLMKKYISRATAKLISHFYGINFSAESSSTKRDRLWDITF